VVPLVPASFLRPFALFSAHVVGKRVAARRRRLRSSSPGSEPHPVGQQNDKPAEFETSPAQPIRARPNLKSISEPPQQIMPAVIAHVRAAPNRSVFSGASKEGTATGGAAAIASFECIRASTGVYCCQNVLSGSQPRNACQRPARGRRPAALVRHGVAGRTPTSCCWSAAATDGGGR
jgi:hypothetical protein